MSSGLSQLSRVMSVAAMAILIVGVSPRPAAAQESVSDILSFLLTNRSIPTGDFVQDERAAEATRDTVSGFLLLELASAPVSSSSGGFSYRLNPTLGTIERSSDSFGPFLMKRSLTSGTRRATIGLRYREASFDKIDGRSLRDGTLIATATKFRDQPQPFDVETLKLDVLLQTVTLLADYGLTDRLDIGAAVPFVTLNLSGQRIDTYRGQAFVQANASVTASGLGDVALHAKYNVLGRAGSGLALGSEVRLPTGDRENLLGSGNAVVKPLFIGSVEQGRLAAHVNLGYTFSRASNEFNYGAAVTVAGTNRLTLVGEIAGRHVEKLGTLTEVSEPNRQIAGADTIRLQTIGQGTAMIDVVAGFKWNLASTWLLSCEVLLPATKAGVTTRWTPSVALDYSF